MGKQFNSPFNVLIVDFLISWSEESGRVGTTIGTLKALNLFVAEMPGKKIVSSIYLQLKTVS